MEIKLLHRNIAIYKYLILGLTKSEIYTLTQNNIAQVAKVLGHPARIAILQYLFKTNSCVCGDLVDEIGLAQATISQHLKELKNIGLIQGTIEGTSVCYCVNQERWKEVVQLLSSFLSQKPESIFQNCKTQ